MASEDGLNRIAFIGIGFSLACGGLIAVGQQEFYSSFYRHFIDFSPHHKIVGFAMILCGICFGWVGIKRRGTKS